jgi:hypothetical protein
VADHGANFGLYMESKLEEGVGMNEQVVKWVVEYVVE